MISYARPLASRLVGGRTRGSEGEGLPASSVPSAPPVWGSRVKFQPPHVTRHGCCFSPRPEPRPPNRLPWTPQLLTPSGSKAQGQGIRCARG